MLVGVEGAQVESAISLIRSTVSATPSEEPQVTLFVVPVSRYETGLAIPVAPGDAGTSPI